MINWRLAIVVCACLCDPHLSLLIASEDSSVAKVPSPAKTGTLVVSGRVVQSDGTSAAGVIVRRMGDEEEGDVKVNTNAAGEFQLRGVFGNGFLLHASSPDGSQQSTLRIPRTALRKSLATQIVLKLEKAVSRKITALTKQKPAAGAKLIAQGTSFRCEAVTGADGCAELRLPPQELPQILAAWHPSLGIAGRVQFENGIAEDSTPLSLHAFDNSPPHTVRIIDPDGHGIPGLDLGISVIVADGEFVMTRYFPEGRVKTDKDGRAIVPWIPRSIVGRLNVQINTPGWKEDSSNDDLIKRGITIIRARRLKAILGRVIMPAGVSPEGILVEGNAFGPSSVGAVSHARTRPDGWFTLLVPADHAYVIGINDVEWASNLWSGKILDGDRLAADRITLKAYKATPVTVRATRGPNHEPMVDGWIHTETNMDFEWIDSAGKLQKGRNGITGWFKTNSKGEATAGLGVGTHSFVFNSNDWTYRKIVPVTSDKPLIVEFHRD